MALTKLDELNPTLTQFRALLAFPNFENGLW